MKIFNLWSLIPLLVLVFAAPVMGGCGKEKAEMAPAEAVEEAPVEEAEAAEAPVEEAEAAEAPAEEEAADAVEEAEEQLDDVDLPEDE